MFAVLDLSWKPSATSTSPPAGKAPAIIRNDPYDHRYRVTDGVAAGVDDYDFVAQIRSARLTGEAAATPLAEFEITVSVDGADVLIDLHLDADVTTELSLPSGGFWDLQITDGPTLLAGKVKVLDDVARAAGS